MDKVSLITVGLAVASLPSATLIGSETSGEVHYNHYLLADGSHYKLADGYYYMVKEVN